MPEPTFSQSLESTPRGWRRYGSYGVRLLALAVLTVSLAKTFDDAPAIAIGAAAALLTGSALLMRAWPLRAIFALVVWGLHFVLSFWATYQARFGPIGYDDFVAIYQTDAPEAAAYLSTLLGPGSIMFPLLAAAGFLGVGPWRRHHRVSRSGIARVAEAVVAILFTVGSVAVLVAELPRQDVAEQWHHLVESIEDFRAQRAEQWTELSGGGPAGGPVARARLNGNIILVLGESMTRRHMSLYGYHRPTTPVLDSMRDELFVQTDTVSPHSHTPLTVPPMFGIPIERGLPRPFPSSLIGAFRRSGLKTFWYSNQNEIGAWENPIALIARSADVWEFQKRRVMRALDSPLYDGGLVPRLERALADPAPAKFITLHFYAPHWRYCGVFPHGPDDLSEEAGLGTKFFGAARDRSRNVNCYDNAIRYIDGILGRVIRLAHDANEPTAVVFVPDHGENPAAGTAHNASDHSAYHVEIPLVWYVNASGRRQWQTQIDVLRTHLAEPFVNAYLGHSLLDLAGADARLFDQTQSLLSPTFHTRPRRLFERDPERAVYYDTLEPDRKDYLEIARVGLQALHKSRPRDWEKTWASGVNSLGTLMEAKDLFAGVQLDVVFDATRGSFFVNHPPSADIDLSLEEYLKAASSRPELRMWFAWQNAGIESFAASLAELSRLDREFNLRKRVVVETNSTALFPALRQLKQNGFFHSYHLPTKEVASCAEREEADGCEELARSIVGNATGLGADALSFDAHAMPFVQAHARLLSRYKLLAWSPDINSAEREFAAKLPPLDRLSTFLVMFPSMFNE